MLPKRILGTIPRNISCGVPGMTDKYATALRKCSEQRFSWSAIQVFASLRIALFAQRVRDGLRERTNLSYDRACLFTGHSRDVDGSFRLIGCD
jgi:hypothetical protein